MDLASLLIDEGIDERAEEADRVVYLPLVPSLGSAGCFASFAACQLGPDAGTCVRRRRRVGDVEVRC